MNNIFLLLKYDFITLKGKYFKLLLFAFLLPLSLILFFSIPLSYVFLNLKPIYLIWSTAGISVISTIIFSFINNINSLFNKLKKEFIFSVPVSFSNIILSVYLFSMILSMLEFSISIILINSLNNNFLSILDCLFIFLLLIPSIFIFTAASIITACFMKERISFIVLILFLFVVASFGLGAFLPLSIYPDLYYNIIKYFPLSSSMLNIQKIISADYIYFSYLIVSCIYSIFFVLLSIVVLNNKIKERLF